MSIPQMSMSVDNSWSIPPHTESGTGIAHETIAHTVPEPSQEFAHPDDVAAMLSEWSQAREEEEFLRKHQWSSAALEHVQNVRPLFPTLNQFTAPVVNLPQWPQTVPAQYYSSQPGAIFQTLAGSAWSQPAHVGGASVNEPGFSQNYYAHSEMGMDHTGYAHATFANTFLPPTPDSASMDLTEDSNMDSSSPDSDETACASGSSHVRRKLRPRPTVERSSRMLRKRDPRPIESEDDSSVSARVLGKRKACYADESDDDSSGSATVLGDRQTGESSSSSLSLPLYKRRKMLQTDDEDDDENKIQPGKFGPYGLANARAVIMPMPIHDPQPVDIRNRRTRDANGNLLKTRRFGAMELDDSFTKRSVTIGNGLPAGMTCVRACGWGDQPCGLFVETNKARITHHLFLWHGVKPDKETLCKFENCPKTEKMINLGRHIEGVHYTTALECAYCGKPNSRSDSLDRHLETCKPYRSAMKAGRKFIPTKPKKLVYGYIVPARDAT